MIAEWTQDPTALVGRELAIPASASNLGPGFDTFGLALRFYLRVRIVGASERPGELTFNFVDRPLVGDNRIERAFLAGSVRHGAPVPSLDLEVRSAIPMRSGLGSSAAATLAGLRLYEVITDTLSRDELLSMGLAIEGHADNLAASLLGGLTGCCIRDDGTVAVWSRRWPEALGLVVATPELELSTADARSVLPAALSRDDAVFNLQRATWLLHVLDRGDYQALGEALCDRWHQPARAALVPGLDRLLQLKHPDLLGVFLSGAGPSVIGLATRNLDGLVRLFADEYAALGLPCDVRPVDVHQPEDTLRAVDVHQPEDS